MTIRKLLNRIRRFKEEKHDLITENEDLKDKCKSLLLKDMKNIQILGQLTLWAVYWCHLYVTNYFLTFSAGFPRIFTFKFVNFKKFMEEYPDFDNRFLNIIGSYELHGFGIYDRYELKMGSTMDGLHQLTPIWKKTFICIDADSQCVSQYFIFFNQTRSRWELHEKKIYNGLSTSITYDHIFCSTGWTNQFLLFYIDF